MARNFFTQFSSKNRHSHYGQAYQLGSAQFFKKSSRTKQISIGILALALVFITWHSVRSQSQVNSTNSSTNKVLAAETTNLHPTGMNANFMNQVNKCFLPISSLYGFNLYISAGFRSYSDQDTLYAQGRTVDGHIVTNAQGGQSIHNFGLAIDVADHAYGINIDYAKLGTIASYCGLEHGDRGYVDLPHFEYRGGLSLEQLQAGEVPKPLTLPCPIMQTTSQLTLSQLKACGAPNFTGKSSSIYVPYGGGSAVD